VEETVETCREYGLCTDGWWEWSGQTTYLPELFGVVFGIDLLDVTGREHQHAITRLARRNHVVAIAALPHEELARHHLHLRLRAIAEDPRVE